MFTEEQARGRTRIVDPDLDAVNSPQRVRNYSEPSPFPTATSTVGVTPIHAHHRSPLSVHPTTTSSRNRTSASTPSPILLSDRRAPIVSGTSNSSPATFTSNPRSALDISPSMRRFQMIQAALEQEAGSGPVTPRGHGQVRSPLLSNANTSNFRSLTLVSGPSSSSRTRALERAATASPDTFRNPIYTGSDPASTNRRRESASISVGFDARAPPVDSGHPSHTNTHTYKKPNMTTGGGRTSNPTIAVKSSSEPSSSSRGLQRTRPLSPDTFHSTSRLATFDSLGRSSASPRAVVRTPKWLPPYPTARTPSPDSECSPRTRSSSPGPSDELLSPLSNVNLNSFALDNNSHKNSNKVEGNTPSASFDSSTRHSVPRTRGLHTRSQSPPVFGTPSTSTSDRPVSIWHDSDPRSPILGGNQIPELHKR